MSVLFDEILTCTTCPGISVITNENEEQVKAHLTLAHEGVSVTAFVMAKRPEERQWLEDVYEEAKAYLDSNFPSKFLRHFDQCAWELCTYKYLVDNGIEIYLPTRDAGPDFDTSIGYVECIAVNRGNAANAVPLQQASILQADGTFEPEVSFTEVPINAIKLRISSAIAVKTGKYIDYTSKDWFDTSKPRLIALNWNCEGSVMMSDSRNIATNAALQTLFATGFAEIVIDTEKGEVIDERLSRVPILIKANNSEIEVGYFAAPPSEDSHRIDGVILSSKWAGQYRPDTYRLVSNPFTMGFDIDTFSIGHKTTTMLNIDKGYIAVRTES